LKTHPASDYGDRYSFGDDYADPVERNSANLDAGDLRERRNAINDSGRIKPNHLSRAWDIGRREHLVRSQ
jgi:hypothetical protein